MSTLLCYSKDIVSKYIDESQNQNGNTSCKIREQKTVVASFLRKTTNTFISTKIKPTENNILKSSTV